MTLVMSRKTIFWEGVERVHRHSVNVYDSPGITSTVFFFLPFLGPLPWHMEVPRLGAESEL